MKPSMIGKAALLLTLGLARAGLAQQTKASLNATGSYPVGQVDGTSTAYYALYPGGINYGLSGTFPNLGGYGYQGYGPGPQFGAHYQTKPGASESKSPRSPLTTTPKASANRDHLPAALRQATKKPIGTPKAVRMVPKPAGKQP